MAFSLKEEYGEVVEAMASSVVTEEEESRSNQT
jgi:hypothetical protein